MTTLADIKKNVLFLTRTVEAQYKADELLRNINAGYDDLVLQIWKADSTWRYDEGIDHLPIAVTNLVKDQRDYQLPTEARRVERVEVEIDGDVRTLTPIVDTQVLNHKDNSGIPSHYYIKGRSLYLFPVANKAVEGGLSVYLSKSVTPLVEDEDEVKVDREFSRYPAFSAVRDWYFSTKQTREYQKALNEIDRIKQDIVGFYGSRNSGYKRGFSVKRQNYL